MSSVSVTIWGLLALAVLPILLFTYLPMTDLPEHMLLAKILVSYDDPAFDYSQNFVMRIPWNPYSTFFWFALLTAPFVGIPLATKLYITATFVLTIVGLRGWVLAVVPEKEPNVMLAIPLLYGSFFYIGMINFLFSIPFVFFALTLGWRVGSQKASRLEVVALSGALLIIWFSHPISFALTLMLLGFQTLMILRGRNVLTLCIASILPMTVAVTYFVFSVSDDIAGLVWAYEPWRSRAALLLMPFGISQGVLTSQLRLEPIVPFYWLFVIACLVASLLLRSGKGKESNAWRGLTLPGILLVAATLLLPSTIGGGLTVAMRAAPLAAYALVVTSPVRWYQHAVLRYLAISACAVALLMVAYRVWEFQRDMQDFEGAVSVIPPHQRVQPVLTDLNTRHLTGYPFLHVTAWYNQWKGGTSPYLFTQLTYVPVHDRAEVMPNVPGEWMMKKFRYVENQKGTDYFLFRTGDAEILEDLVRNVPLAAEVGEWKVFGPNVEKR